MNEVNLGIRSKQIDLLESGIEDRSHVQRAIGELNGEGRPASPEAEAEGICRRFLPGTPLIVFLTKRVGRSGAVKKEQRFFTTIRYAVGYYVGSFCIAFFMTVIYVFYFLPLLLTGRIKIYGKDIIKNTDPRNRIIICNHPSMLDPFLIVSGCFCPWMLKRPWKYFPWTPGQEPFIKDSKLYFLRWLRQIPVYMDSRDWIAVRKTLRLLNNFTIILFVEGMRSKNAKLYCKTSSGMVLGEPRGGVGMIVAHADPTVIPVLIKIDGAGFSANARFPNFLKGKMEVIIGDPLKISATSHEKSGRLVYTDIARRAMDAIAELDTDPKPYPYKPQ